MKINKETLQKIEDVSRLKLTKEEKETFLDELDDVLEAFSKIGDVNTENVEKSLHPLPLEGTTREDSSRKTTISPKEMTDDSERNYYKGPKIK